MFLILAACAAPVDSAEPVPADPTAGWVVGSGPVATLSGQAFLFGPAPELSFAEAEVYVMEDPSFLSPVAADGSFAIAVPTGAPVSLVLRHPELASVQSATLTFGEDGLDDVGFQVPTVAIVELMAKASDVYLEPDRCQFVSTVSSAASPPYGGAGVGEPDAIVTLHPAVPAGTTGPVYFDYLSDALILPDPALEATTIDGGVIFSNLPVGEWTMLATKPGVSFTRPVARCQAGAIVNAAPPHGVETIR